MARGPSGGPHCSATPGSGGVLSYGLRGSGSPRPQPCAQPGGTNREGRWDRSGGPPPIPRLPVIGVEWCCVRAPPPGLPTPRGGFLSFLFTATHSRSHTKRQRPGLTPAAPPAGQAPGTPCSSPHLCRAASFAHTLACACFPGAQPKLGDEPHHGAGRTRSEGDLLGQRRCRRGPPKARACARAGALPRGGTRPLKKAPERRKGAARRSGRLGQGRGGARVGHCHALGGQGTSRGSGLERRPFPVVPRGQLACSRGGGATLRSRTWFTFAALFPSHHQVRHRLLNPAPRLRPTQRKLPVGMGSWDKPGIRRRRDTRPRARRAGGPRRWA